MAKEAVPVGRIHRLLAVGPVTLVTASLRGRSDLTTVAWTTPLSADPPLVGLALRPGTLIHELIRGSEEFTINIPPAALAREVHYCGTVSGTEADKWAVTGLHPASARQGAAPWVEECVAHLECGLIHRQPVGDHELFIGQVLVAWADPAAFTDGWQPTQDAGQLLHHLGGSRYGLLTTVLDAGKPRTE